MFFRPLKSLHFTHYIKVTVPLVLLVAVIMSKGIIQEYVGDFFQKKFNKATSIFNVKVDSENKKFVSALLAERKLGQVEVLDLGHYRDRKFIQSIKNDPDVFTEKAPAENVLEGTSEETAGVAEEASVVVEPIGNPPIMRVRTIFNGNIRKFAVINDKMYNINSTLPSGETLIGISKGKIQVEGKWGKRWLYVNY
jgi:hypothetical protein